MQIKNKIMCIYCGEKEVTKTIMPDGRIWLDISCEDCAAKHKHLDDNLDMKTCVECGKKLDDFGVTCDDCLKKREERIDRARKDGRCTMCYKNPQANLLTIDGEKTQFCEKCAEQFHKMLLIHDLNRAVNDPKMFKKVWGDTAKTIKKTKKKFNLD